MEAWFQIPKTHDPLVRDDLARWKILRRAADYRWDAGLGSTWHRPPTTERFAPLLTALDSRGLDAQEFAHPRHREVLEGLQHHAAHWSMAEAASAFVAGLWSAPAAWRSALVGVLLGRSIPDHAPEPYGEAHSGRCRICGLSPEPIQLIEAWSMRLGAGSPLDGEPAQHAQMLEWMGEQRVQPTEYDRWTLGAIRTIIQALPAGTRYAGAVKAIKSAKILRGTHTAISVLEDLALAGVLAAPERPGLAERFTAYVERDQRPDTRVEVQAPLAWWSTETGCNGIRSEVFEQIFGTLDIPEVDLDAARPVPQPAAKDTLDGGLAARSRALGPKEPRGAVTVGNGPASPGDIWAIRLKPGRWVSVYVHDMQIMAGRSYARVEFLAGEFAQQPLANELTDRAQPRRDGRWSMWVHSLEKTSWVRRIAQGKPVPVGDGPVPGNESQGAAKELLHLADWCFD